VAAMRDHDYENGPSTIMNPKYLSASDSVDFCGACHRTWADVAMGMSTNMGAAKVRFQPYRLEMSRCWGAGVDARITCIACHDPHQRLVHELSSYDAKCLRLPFRREGLNVARLRKDVQRWDQPLRLLPHAQG
jgi:hypothetical protein